MRSGCHCTAASQGGASAGPLDRFDRSVRVARGNLKPVPKLFDGLMVGRGDLALELRRREWASAAVGSHDHGVSPVIVELMVLQRSARSGWSVPPWYTLRSCMPRQIASIGKRRAKAASRIDHSIVVAPRDTSSRRRAASLRP